MTKKTINDISISPAWPGRLCVAPYMKPNAIIRKIHLVNWYILCIAFIGLGF